MFYYHLIQFYYIKYIQLIFISTFIKEDFNMFSYDYPSFFETKLIAI